MEIVVYYNLKKSLIEEIDLNFERESISYDACVPYKAKDQEFAQKVANFFSNRRGLHVGLEEMEREFGRELSSAIMFLGWDAKRAMMGDFLRAGLESYQNGHHFIEIIEHLLINDHSSDDRSKSYFQWVNEFNREQKFIILNFILLVRFDFLKMYIGTIFRGDFMMWVE